MRISLVLAVWSTIFLSFLFLLNEEMKVLILNLPAAIIAVILLVLIFPWPEKRLTWERGKPDQIDERNIMFSRAELIPGSEKYKSYYEEFPDHKAPDDAFRELAGLMKPGSTFYNPWVYGAAEATFETVARLHPWTDGPTSDTIRTFSPDQVTRFISTWIRDMGSHSLGITPLLKHHLYHTGGRYHNYGETITNDHALAIVFTVEMDFQPVRSSPMGPIVLETSTQYLHAGTIAVRLAAFIRSLGYSARAHIDGKYQLRCTEVAKDAGLGELGRMGLLMTPKLGPRVRIGVVTTDLPLTISPPKPDPSVIKFCQLCKKCAECCPSQAIMFDEPGEIGGTTQWVIDQEACYTYWCKVGTDCGRCMAVCPYSHPDNLLHNIVRVLIKKAPLFRLFALRMDNWLYGEKPQVKKLPDWMVPDSKNKDQN